jgi:hypothetical protein
VPPPLKRTVGRDARPPRRNFQFRVVVSQRAERSVEDVREWNETGALESPARRSIPGIATGARDCAERIRFAFEFLNKERAEAAPAVPVTHFHVDVAVRPVVVKQEAAFRTDAAR